MLLADRTTDLLSLRDRRRRLFQVSAALLLALFLAAAAVPFARLALG